jgi:dolichol-phosphate mannosyltransferase
LNDSLSMVVPVCNAGQTLAGQVVRLLDVLSDLSARIQIVLVDDASTDHTVDVARELATQFPQVRLVRHRDRRGVQASVRTGLLWASGRIVFVQEDAAQLRTGDLRRLWSLRHDEELVLGPADLRPRVFDEQLLARVAECFQQPNELPCTPGATSGIHMLSREAALWLLADEAEGEAATCAHVPDELHARTDAPHAPAPPRRATTFLRHLRDLVRGQ